MSKNNNTASVTAYFGDQPAYEHERRAISAIRAELERRNIPATLLVNFTVARGSRQIDLVIATATRVLNVELKHLDPSLALLAPENGPWCQQRIDGTQRSLERNFAEQALQQTYGLSDVFDRLAREGKVPHPQQNKFAKDIDTVVCCDPQIPPGSVIDKRAYVAVIGLGELVDRVTRPGPGLPNWTQAHWDEAIRRLGLYSPTDDSPEEMRRRADAAAVEDYRRHFRRFTSTDVPALIPAESTTITSPQGRPDWQGTLDATALANRLTPYQQQRIVLSGASGQGKTHLATHTAIALTDLGQMVVWIAADDYENGRLSRSLNRAVAPFSTSHLDADTLIAKAADGGTGITVIVDALEKCPQPDELVKQLHALQNRYPTAILVTTASEEDVAHLATTERIELTDPSGDERARLATVYGTSDRVADSDEYRTRLEISVAAQVVSELPPDATNTDTLDAYIRRRTQGETVRAGLRCLAVAMDSGVRTALPIADAELALRRFSPLVAAPWAIDDVLDSQLVHTRQGRLRFQHERLSRFLAAEHLVISAEDGQALAQLLNQPTQRDLRDDALRLERDPVRRYDTLRHLGDPRVLAAAAQGAFGEETRRIAVADITELLVAATAAAPEASLSVDPHSEHFHSGNWHNPRQWTANEKTLLIAAGHCVYNGLFLTEIGALMDATDIAVRKAMREVRDAGGRAAISTVVASSFERSPATQHLAAGLITCGAHDARIFDRADTGKATATAMWRPNPRCYGRLFLAAYLSHPVRHPTDAENLADLVATGLAAGGYHLRLELIQAAQFGCGVLKDDARHRMIDVLNGYDSDPRDWGTNTLLIETLASYGEIEPINSLEGIQAEIAELLNAPDNPELHPVALSVVSRMFEDERVLGPYSEAIDTLPEDQRMMLFAMAALAPEDSFVAGPYSLRQLSDGVHAIHGIVARALAQHAGAVPDDTFDRQHAVASHLYALRGWARVSDALPPSAERSRPLPIAWRLVDELLLLMFRNTTGTALTEAIWRQLISELPAAAAMVLHDIYRANIEHYGGMEPFDPHQDLLSSYPEHVRELLEWALAHRESIRSADWYPMGGVSSYAVRTLGRVGTAQTADLLRHHYVHDAELGGEAVQSVHAIDTRTQG